VTAAAGGAAALRFRPWAVRRVDDVPVTVSGANAGIGHLLRGLGAASTFPTPEPAGAHPVVIVGGGIAGLSAAWWLDRSGAKDFTLLELDAAAGGNSRVGSGPAGDFPLGAHYLPVPGPRAQYVRALLEEMGVIQGYDDRGRPKYDELAVCSAPRERLFIHGQWQDGVIPHLGLAEREQLELDAFFALMARYRKAVGEDGKPAFAIPVDESSRDPAFTALDSQTLTAFLAGHGLTSAPLLWYVDYCCRDDFGTTAAATSAWAGIHYFASRHGDNEDDEQEILTWPEGNGRFVKHLTEKAGARVRSGALVFNVEPRPEGGAYVDYLDVASKKALRIEAGSVIFAAPRFVARFVVAPWRREAPPHLAAFSYAPWMVANVTLDRMPVDESGAQPAWDNVRYGAPSLGYVVSSHQSLAAHRGRTVLTHYWPLADEEPRTAREKALAETPAGWRKRVLEDLGRMHKGLEARVESVDVWIWGHGMIRPVPGFVWGEARQAALAPLGPIHFAHSDMSGLSIFEEAQYRGVEAAKAVLRGVGA